MQYKPWLNSSSKRERLRSDSHFFLGVNSFSHTAAVAASHMCSPVSPGGSCTKCLAAVTLQSPCKRRWLHTSEGRTPHPPRPHTPCVTSAEALSSFSRASPFSPSAVSSAGKICHSRFACGFALQLDTFEKERGVPVPGRDGVNPLASCFMLQ